MEKKREVKQKKRKEDKYKNVEVDEEQEQTQVREVADEREGFREEKYKRGGGGEKLSLNISGWIRAF